MASPGVTDGKHTTGRLAAQILPVRSAYRSPVWVRQATRSGGVTSSSASVRKTTGSSSLSRSVLTWVPAGTRTGWGGAR